MRFGQDALVGSDQERGGGGGTKGGLSEPQVPSFVKKHIGGGLVRVIQICITTDVRNSPTSSFIFIISPKSQQYGAPFKMNSRLTQKNITSLKEVPF